MTAAEPLLDAFINANILFCLGYLLWLAVRMGMRRAGLQHAYGTQLLLLNAVFLAILFAPLIALLARKLQEAGISGAVNFNLSDLVVSYYLNGGFEMKAAEFERLVLMRDGFTLNLLNGEGVVAHGVIAVFLAGVAIGTLRLAYSLSCLRRIVASGFAWRRIGRVHILLSENTLVPFSTRGLRAYYVVIPSHMLEKDLELKVALAHEFQHIRQGDLEWEWALEALKPIFFFNPAYRAWKRQVEQLRELRCDSAVITSGRIDLRAYCETLLSVCQKTLRRDRRFLLAVPKVTLVTADRVSLFKRNKSLLQQRILAALEGRRTRHQRLVFALIAVPLLVVMSLAVLAVQSPGDWSHDRLMLSTVVNLDRLDEINRLSTFGRQTF